VRLLVFLLALAFVWTPVHSEPLSYYVKSSDGVALSVQEYGSRGRPDIVFLHGFNQSHLTWKRQLTPEMLAKYHIVTFDMRGHGASDQPQTRAGYQDSGLWADDVATVIRTAGAQRPVLVGWSMGGRVLMDYIDKYGSNVAGIVFVASGIIHDSSLVSTVGGNLVSNMLDSDLERNISATTSFLRACFERQPSAEDFDEMLAYNMVVTPQARRAMVGRPMNFVAKLQALNVPVLIIQGEQDKLNTAAMSRAEAAMIPSAKLLLYPGAGHSTFYEDAARFNADLAAFVDHVGAAGESVDKRCDAKGTFTTAAEPEQPGSGNRFRSCTESQTLRR
jgi:non-heme chloroperoxidase